ncbi:hypothetical protein [Neobacillus sp. SAB-20_R2A]
MKYLKPSDKTIKSALSQLVDKKMLMPASRIMRIGFYRLWIRLSTQSDK